MKKPQAAVPDTGAFRLKDNMLLGVAAAATQIEGGDKNNSWYDWYEKGHIQDGSDPSRADDHYRLYSEDTELMASMKIQIYRMGIEWSRIQPEPDRFDNEAVQHYRDEITLLRKKNIKVLLTLHHFSNPLWFEKMGAFENPQCVDIFIRFVSFIVEKLGDIVSEFITLNEPNVYAVNGYVFGLWPPGKKKFPAAMKVLQNCALCHIEAYKLIHRIRMRKGFMDTKVGFANHLRILAPKPPYKPYNRLSSPIMECVFQGCMTKAMHTGVFRLPLKHASGVQKGRYFDFIGINYYTRSTVAGFRDGTRQGAPVNDLGWEIYPQGLAELSVRMHRLYQAPVYITENGTCDAKDTFRAKYIYDHLRVLCGTDVTVERYYHWTFMDNFEWLEGESAAFGLVKVDYPTQARTIRPSGAFYTASIENGGVTEDMYEQYVETPRPETQ